MSDFIFKLTVLEYKLALRYDFILINSLVFCMIDELVSKKMPFALKIWNKRSQIVLLRVNDMKFVLPFDAVTNDLFCSWDQTEQEMKFPTSGELMISYKKS